MQDDGNEKPGAVGTADRVGIDAPGEMRGHSMSTSPASSSLLERWRLALTAVADARLSKADVAVLVVIADHLNATTGEAYPGADRLRRITGKSLRAIKYSRRKLVDLGYLIERRHPNDQRNHYRMGTPTGAMDCTSAADCTSAMDSTDRCNALHPTGAILCTGPVQPVAPEHAYRTNLLNQLKEPTKKRTQKARAGDQDSIGDLIGLELPEGLTRENWTAYVKHRAGMPKAKRLTDTSAAMCLRKLKAWATQGHDPNDIVSTSVANGWQGLIEPKGPPTKTAGRVSVPSQQQADEINARADAKLAKLRIVR